jgi:hypothetical protein
MKSNVFFEQHKEGEVYEKKSLTQNRPTVLSQQSKVGAVPIPRMPKCFSGQ